MKKAIVSTMIMLTFSVGVFVSMSFAVRAKKNKTYVNNESGTVSNIQAVPLEDILDTMDNTEKWKTYVDKKSKLTLISVPGKFGNAIEASYDFAAGSWVAFKKENNKDFSKVKAIRFYYKGRTNAIQIKLEDRAGSTFGASIKAKTDIARWTAVEIALSQFEYWWGGNPGNSGPIWSEIKSIHILIGKDKNDYDTAGKVIFDQIEFVK